MTDPKVYIAVLNWNGYEQTSRCVESLSVQAYTNYEIMVIDNASTDGSFEQLRARFPNLLTIHSAANLGYAGGMKLGLDAIQDDPQADFYWILNYDTVVRPDTLGKLVEAYERNGSAVYGAASVSEEAGQLRVVGRIGQPDTGRFPTVRQFFSPACDGKLLEACFPNKTDCRVVKLSGSNMLLPLEVVREHGFLNPEYFMYGEDGDYCLRLAQKGIARIIVPSALIFHPPVQHIRRSTKIRAIMRYYQVRNRLILIRHYWGAWAYTRAVFNHLFFVLAWALVGVVKRSHHVMFSYYALLGLRDSLINRMGRTYAPEVER